MKEFIFDKNYLVTEKGEIFSIRRGGKPFRIKKQRDISGQYERVMLSEKAYLVHRMVAITFIPNPEDLPQVNHKDGDKLNNVVSNLEWCTSGENQIHAYNNGLKKLPKGLLNGRQELTEEEVICIYNKLLQGESSKSMASIYGVTPTQITRIKAKKAWSHITKDLPDLVIAYRSTTLSEEQKNQLLLCSVEGLTFKEAKSKMSFDFTNHQYYGLRRNR